MLREYDPDQRCLYCDSRTMAADQMCFTCAMKEIDEIYPEDELEEGSLED